MREVYKNEVVITAGGGYNRRNYFTLLKNSFQLLKNLKILFAVIFILSLFFTSCNVLFGDASSTLSINLPPIASQSRSISSDRLPYLKQETKSYRVTVNGMRREGTDVNYTFTLPVGTVASITVECLNSSGQVIVRAYKEHSVTGGDNVVSIILKNDGDEIINTGVIYSYGDANNGGEKRNLPTNEKVAEGETFTVPDVSQSIYWAHGTFTGWSASVGLDPDAGGAAVTSVPANGGAYIMPSTSVTLTAQWNKNPYTITYSATGNAPGIAGSITPASIGDVTEDALTRVTLAMAPAVSNPVTVGSDRKNYTFRHWKDTNDNDKTYNAGAQITLTKNMDLEAVWHDETVYTVTFVSPPKSVSVQYDQQIPSSPQTVEVGNSLSWTNPSALGWTFEGWEVSDTGDSSVTELPESATSYTPKGNTTLTAKLTAKSYTVNYDVKNGEGTAPNPAPKTIISWDSAGGNFARNDGAGFSRPGYTLTSWEFSDGTSAGTKGVTGGGRVFMEKADGNNSVTVYAVWQSLYKELSAAEVGDVICANGKVLSADDITTELQSETIAVVYKVDSASKKAWAVGKVHDRDGIKWCDSNAAGYNTNITSLQCEPDAGGSAGNYTWTQGQNTDGSDNWQELKNALGNNDDTSTPDYYSAWEWANSYGTTNCGGTNFTSGWYLPTIAELFDIWKANNDNASAIENSFTATGSSSLFAYSTGGYWSSTQVATDSSGPDYRANFFVFTGSGGFGTASKDTVMDKFVCAVRQFTW